MADKNKTTPVHGIVAEFTSVDSLMVAARRIRDAGYKKIDAFTPFPVHGIDEALGIRPTVLPWIALAGGLTGTVTALAMQIFMNGIDYKYIISGKPFLSLPAFIPVAFELTILLASFGAFFGMLALNGLPRFSNPMFTDPRFDRATDDRFFLYVDAKDERFDAVGVERLLGETGSEYIHTVVEDDSSRHIPRVLLVLLGLLIALSIIPTLLVAKMRVTKSRSPRFHIFNDMDFSPAKDMQQISTLFADGRAMRPDVPGTVARGQSTEDPDFMTGIDIDALSRLDRPRAERLVRAFSPLARLDAAPQQADGEAEAVTEVDPEPQSPADEPASADEPAPADETEPTARAESGDTPAAGEEPDVGPPDQPTSPSDQSAPGTPSPPTDAPGRPQPASGAPPERDLMPGEVPLRDAPSPAAPGSAVDNTPWLKSNPLTITPELLAVGQQQFNIYCAVCHGVDGAGNGLVNRRAQRILAPTWTPPSTLHDTALASGTYPDGKLFSVITNGIRKMPGYGAQIAAPDRWAVVAYVRALQRSQNASLEAVPSERREEIQKRQQEVEKILAEQAEQEKQREQERAAAEKTPA